MLPQRANFGAIFIRRYCTRVRAATKVTISFGNAADIVTNAQDRLRFSFGSAAAQKRNAARRCKIAI
jgi:hypothetical protein